MLNAVNDGARSVALSEQKAKGQGSCPRDNLDKDQYLADRLRKQIAYYESSADKLSKPSRWLHGAEIVLAGAAALISAVAASVGKGGFDLASLTAVVTTLAGTVLAHLQAARYDEQIVNYRATALRLQNLDASAATEPSAASLAAKAEEIIAGETKGWQALWLAENKKSQP